jgi:predicted secreted Zn-dependent protease
MLNALSLSAISFALNFSQVAAVTPGPVVSVSRLADVPNTTIRYYDVTGKDLASINQSIARQRPKAPGAGLAPASLAWSVKASFEQRTEKEQCKVTSARAMLTATADLPRLVDEHAMETPMLGRWRHYAAELEASQLVALVFVYSHLDRVEQAMLASTCQGAKAAGTAAVEQLRNRTTALTLEREQRYSLSQWLLTDADVTDAGADKVICKDLAGPASSRNPLHVCMVPREWETLRESGE